MWVVQGVELSNCCEWADLDFFVDALFGLWIALGMTDLLAGFANVVASARLQMLSRPEERDQA